MLAFESGPSVDGGGFETIFLVVFGVAALLVLAGFVFVGYGMYRSARAAKRAGIDPFTSEAQLIAQAVGGSGPTLEQRLKELDDLHRRGVISAEEHQRGRAQAITGA